jgi:hypothetical protein
MVKSVRAVTVVGLGRMGWRFPVFVPEQPVADVAKPCLLVRRERVPRPHLRTDVFRLFRQAWWNSSAQRRDPLAVRRQ